MSSALFLDFSRFTSLTIPVRLRNNTSCSIFSSVKYSHYRDISCQSISPTNPLASKKNQNSSAQSKSQVGSRAQQSALHALQKICMDWLYKILKGTWSSMKISDQRMTSEGMHIDIPKHRNLKHMNEFQQNLK